MKLLYRILDFFESCEHTVVFTGIEMTEVKDKKLLITKEISNCSKCGKEHRKYSTQEIK